MLIFQFLQMCADLQTILDLIYCRWSFKIWMMHRSWLTEPSQQLSSRASQSILVFVAISQTCHTHRLAMTLSHLLSPRVLTSKGLLFSLFVIQLFITFCLFSYCRPDPWCLALWQYSQLVVPPWFWRCCSRDQHVIDNFCKLSAEMNLWMEPLGESQDRLWTVKYISFNIQLYNYKHRGTVVHLSSSPSK
jgi:hypothetical protein